MYLDGAARRYLEELRALQGDDPRGGLPTCCPDIRSRRLGSALA